MLACGIAVFPHLFSLKHFLTTMCGTGPPLSQDVKAGGCLSPFEISVWASLTVVTAGLWTPQTVA